jgi:ribosomal protein S3AE
MDNKKEEEVLWFLGVDGNYYSDYKIRQAVYLFTGEHVDKNDKALIRQYALYEMNGIDKEVSSDEVITSCIDKNDRLGAIMSYYTSNICSLQDAKVIISKRMEDKKLTE